MLKSNQRLRYNKDFIRVFKKGKRHSFGGVLLSYGTNSLGHTRIGFVISKKYSLSAIKRNRQRRILQNAMQKFYPMITPGFDIVVSYTNCDKMLPWKEAVAILTKILNKTKLLIT